MYHNLILILNIKLQYLINLHRPKLTFYLIGDQKTKSQAISIGTTDFLDLKYKNEAVQRASEVFFLSIVNQLSNFTGARRADSVAEWPQSRVANQNF